MKYAFAVAILLCAMTGEAMAGTLILSGSRGSTTVGSSCNCTGVLNTGTINGGTSTGLTVTGTPTRSVTNTGRISGSTGVLITGTSSSTFTNTGTVLGTGTGTTSATAVGVSQLP